MCTKVELNDPRASEKFARDAAARRFDAAVILPPTGSFSPLRFRSARGQKPTRSAAHPRGFPWLQGAALEATAAANAAIDRCVTAARALHDSGAHFLLIAPEDMGQTREGHLPSSIWQWPELKQLARDTGADTGAFYQCDLHTTGCHQMNMARPTRVLGTTPGVRKLPNAGWPRFNKNGGYVGPLPSRCGHRHPKSPAGTGGGALATRCPHVGGGRVSDWKRSRPRRREGERWA